MKNAKIIIATHKKYAIPQDELYIPIHVGAEGKNELGYQKDNIGENISSKNQNYCELTGLYWAWKNLSCDYLGLVHYRRYLSGKYAFNVNGKVKKILSQTDVNKLLKDVDIIVPNKRNYYIETLYSHYAHTLHVEPLDKTGEIIDQYYPLYSKEFKRLKTRRSAHMFNMFIMKKELLNEYCEWLFGVLGKLESKVDASQYDSFHARFYGRISELLLDVWINTNRYRYKEIKFVNIEKSNTIKRIVSFLKAKFKKEKYGKSF